MTGQPYEIDLTRTARRALAERLPLDVVIGASEFINAPWQTIPAGSARSSIGHITACTHPEHRR